MIKGIEVTITFTPPAPFTDGWLDAVYSSLEGNMSVVSIDLFANEDAGELKFLLGVEGFDHREEQFFHDIAREALEKALDDAAGPNTRAGTECEPRSIVFAA